MQVAIRKNLANINPDSVKQAVAAKVDSAQFVSWIAPLSFNICDNNLSLVAQNQFSADFIRRVYLNTIEMVADEFGLTVSLTAGRAQPSNVQTANNDNEVRAFVPSIQQTAQKHTGFDRFISSDENAFVLSACKKLASGSASFSPLFIYGPAGCGKSLLADCIHGGTTGRTLMMTGGGFVSEFVRAMNQRSVFAFKDFCRNCDTFIMDDVQVLAGKRASMDEFVQLILDLRSAGKQIVLVANAAPSNLGGFDRRAQSLMASGLVADIAVPNKTVKKTMLTRAGVALDVAEMLSSRVAGNGHLIAGVASKVNAYTELMDERVTTAVAEKLLADSLQKNKTPLSMVKSMCEKLGVSFDEVCGSGRARTIVRARQIMMVALKSATNLSLAEIGRTIGDRDHATVIYGISQIEKMKSTDLVLSAQIEQMISECR